MKHKNVLKRAWNLLWSYKALWIFGIILAVTTFSFSPQSSYRLSSRDDSIKIERHTFPSDDEFGEWFEERVDNVDQEFQRFWRGENLNQREQSILNMVILMLCVFLALIPIVRALYYIGETALIKMVDEVEESGKRYRIKEGFALGWSKEAWKLFLVDIAIFLPMFVLTIAALALSAWPLLAGFVGTEVRNMIALVSSIGLFFLVILIGVILGTLIRLMKHFMRRKVVLEQTGVFDAIRQGSSFVFQHIKDVGLMWLINVGINIAWPILLIPIVVLVFGFGAVGGGLTALLTYVVSSGSITAVSIFGGTIFFLIMLIPLFFVGGLKATYLSTVWTLTYRELTAIDTLEGKLLENGEPEDIGEN